MKIMLISASPNKEKSQSFALAKEVLRGAQGAGAESEIIQLCDLKITPCLAQETCHKEILACPTKDDVPEILDKMLEAEGIILATPNYINQVTAVMKALMDRSNHFIHCKRLLGKYIAGVVSLGGGSDKEVLDYIKFYAHICGAQYSGGVSKMGPMNEKKKEQACKLGEKLAQDIRDKKEFPEQIKVIEQGRSHFKRLMQMMKDVWAPEYKYWQEKGWI
ncbi:flavodoxin family protein [Candidatus Omnitrophota bacterium]